MQINIYYCMLCNLLSQRLVDTSCRGEARGTEGGVWFVFYLALAAIASG